MADFEDNDWLRNINNADDLKKVFYRIKGFDKDKDTVDIEQADGTTKTYSMADEEDKTTEEDKEKEKEGEESKTKEEAEKTDGKSKVDWAGVRSELEYATIDALPQDIREWVKKFRQFEGLGKSAVDSFFSPVRSFDKKGNFEEVLPSGEKVAEGRQTEAGELDGPYTLFYPDGQKMLFCHYNNGVMEGPCIRYYDNGQEMEICTYKNGKREGEVHTFEKDGTPRPVEMYHNAVNVKESKGKATARRGAATKTDTKTEDAKTTEAVFAGAIAASTPKKSWLGRLVDWAKEKYTVYKYKNMTREDAILIAKKQDKDYKTLLSKLKKLKKAYKNDMEAYNAMEAKLMRAFDRTHSKKKYAATWDRVQAKLKAEKEAKDFKRLKKYRRMRAAFMRKQKGRKSIRKDLCKQLKALREALSGLPDMVDEEGKWTPRYYRMIREFKATHSAEMKHELAKDRKGHSEMGAEYYEKATKEVSKEVRKTDHVNFGAFENKMNKIIDSRASEPKTVAHELHASEGAARPTGRDGGR